jgi:hypothetical protein
MARRFPHRRRRIRRINSPGVILGVNVTRPVRTDRDGAGTGDRSGVRRRDDLGRSRMSSDVRAQLSRPSPSSARPPSRKLSVASGHQLSAIVRGGEHSSWQPRDTFPLRGSVRNDRAPRGQLAPGAPYKPRQSKRNQATLVSKPTSLLRNMEIVCAARFGRTAATSADLRCCNIAKA